ncbi:unnamed protein product [Rodentolepis nana]|uniref:G_PROTEIN_RECEP_F1_2 domain-containing protein n=1 Tax=Rodentolepis nana TaxID=102285 RepID=A0A0R3T4Y2_RODNA|nr:unnamed protein product [Rodentolepis nana]
MDCDSTVLDSIEAVRAYIENCFANSSQREKFRKVLEEFVEIGNSNSAWLNSFLVGLTFVYILMICIGFTGNILVIIVVICNRIMRASPRNLFIFNLAVSDLILCIVTQPLNIYRILSTRHGWQLGLPMCKLFSMVQAMNVYVSSMSITAIALDRFRLIMNPSRQDINVKTVYVIILFLWILGFILSTPIGVFAKVTMANGHLICSETTTDYNMRITKLVYSILSMILLYGTPVTLVSIAYAQICIRVHRRTKNKAPRQTTPIIQPIDEKPLHVQRENTEYSGGQDSSPNRPLPNSRISDVGPLCSYFTPKNCPDEPANANLAGRRKERMKRRIDRHRRTSILLASVAIFFAISWLPMNIVNLLLDLRELTFQVLTGDYPQDQEEKANILLPLVTTPVEETSSPVLPQTFHPLGRVENSLSLKRETILVIQAICLLCVLISACINPMLYGWLNENFRRRFIQLLRCNKNAKFASGGTAQRSKPWQVCKKRSPYALWPKACRRKAKRHSTHSDQLSASTYHPTSQKTSFYDAQTKRSHSLDGIARKSSLTTNFDDTIPVLLLPTESNPHCGILLETDIDAK